MFPRAISYGNFGHRELANKHTLVKLHPTFLKLISIQSDSAKNSWILIGKISEDSEIKCFVSAIVNSKSVCLFFTFF